MPLLGLREGLAAAAALVAAALPARTAEPAGPPSLLLVTVDTLRADRLAAYGYESIETPASDRLAARGVLLEDAVVQVPQTAPSHASLFTGRLPYEHGVRDNYSPALTRELPTLAGLLAQNGYDTAGFIGALPVSARSGLDRGFGSYDDPFSAQGLVTESERPAEAVVDAALAWLRRPRSRPFFVWVHLYDPHDPYQAPDPFGQRYAARPYDGEVAYADAQLGRLLDALESSDARSSTLVVLTSDHGEGLGEHGEQEHLLFVYDSTLRVPMILSWPGVLPEGVRIAGQFRSIDLLPTLLELMELPAIPGSGTSRAAALAAGRAIGPGESYAESLYGQIHFGYAPLRALREGGWKYIEAPRPELYDLRQDPGETRNLAAERDDVAQRMKERLASYDEGAAHAAASAVGVDAGIMERLAALGYVSGAPAAAGSAGADPKDVIAEYQRRKNDARDAARSMRAGDVDAALPILERLAQGDTISFETLFLLGRARMAKGRAEDAIEPLEQALELLPSQAAVYAELAGAYHETGRTADARAILDRGLGTAPDNPALLEMRGIDRYQRGDRSGARADLERARTGAPDSLRVRLALSAIYRDAGDLAAAIGELERAVEAGPRFAEGWHALGVLRARAGREAQAIEAFQHARQLTPGDPDVLFNLADVYARTGRSELARPLLEQLVSTAPDFPGARSALESLAVDAAAAVELRVRVLLAGDRASAEALARRLSSGEELAAVARDALADLGTLSPGELAAPLSDTARQLGPGQVSPPLAAPNGFAVLMRVP